MLFRIWFGGPLGFDEEVDDFFGGATVGVFVGVELGDVEAEQVFVGGEFFQGVADFGVGQAAARGDVYGAEVVAGDYVEVEVQNKIAGVGVRLRQSVGGGFFGAFGDDLFGGDVTQWRL